MLNPTSVVATWAFSHRPSELCLQRLQQDPSYSVERAMCDAIEAIEHDPNVHTVGNFSYPNAEGVLQLDAAMICGTHARTGEGKATQRSMRCGSVMGLEGYTGSIRAAMYVMDKSPHTMLAAAGAAQFCTAQGYPPTPADVRTTKPPPEPIPNYATIFHDTVGLIALRGDTMAVGCSTSGLNKKHPGRIGDSPIIGSGLYLLPGVGAATATGNGDYISQFPLSYECVRLMEAGETPSHACQLALKKFYELPQIPPTIEVAMVAMNWSGERGAGVSPSWVKEFYYVEGEVTKDGPKCSTQLV